MCNAYICTRLWQIVCQKLVAAGLCEGAHSFTSLHLQTCNFMATPTLSAPWRQLKLCSESTARHAEWRRCSALGLQVSATDLAVLESLSQHCACAHFSFPTSAQTSSEGYRSYEQQSPDVKKAAAHICGAALTSCSGPGRPAALLRHRGSGLQPATAPQSSTCCALSGQDQVTGTIDFNHAV